MNDGEYLRAKNPAEIERQLKTFSRLSKTHKSFFKFLRKHIKFNKNSKILEAGCGCGMFTNQIYSEFKSVVEGWDSNKKFINFANKNFKGPTFRIKKIMSKVSESDFDLVLFRETLMEFKDTVNVLKWASNLLKDKGWIAALEPDYGATIIYPEIKGWKKFIDNYSKFCKERGENFFIGRELVDIFTKAGLRSIKVKPLIEIHTSLDKKKLSNFIDIEIMSIQADMKDFLRITGFSRKLVDKIFQEMKELSNHPGVYVQTSMVAICGQKL